MPSEGHKLRLVAVLHASYYEYAADVPSAVQRRANYVWVMCFAVAGTALRKGAGKLGEDVLGVVAPSPTGVALDGALQAVLFHDLLANLAGSLVMGILAGVAPWMLPRFPALHVGLATGLCGCLTTFSSFNNEAAAVYVHGSVWRGLLCTALGVALPLSALRLGCQLGAVFEGALRRAHNRAHATPGASTAGAVAAHGEEEEARSAGGKRDESNEPVEVGAVANGLQEGAQEDAPPPPYPRYNTYKLPMGAALLLLLLAAAAAAAAAAIASGDRESGELFLALLLAPLAASARFSLSARNRHHPTFPIWTLVCNALACLIATLCSVLSHTAAVHASPTAKMFLGAISLGGAGCLSTVSTFVNEVRLLETPHAQRYAVATLVAGLAIALPLWIGFGSM